MSEYATSVASPSSLEPKDPTSLAAAATEIGWEVVPTDQQLDEADPMDPKPAIVLAYAWYLISLILDHLSVNQTVSLAALRKFGPPNSWSEEDLTVSRFQRRFHEFKNKKENEDLFNRINKACMMRFLGTYSAVIMELGSYLGKLARPITAGPCKGIVPNPDKYQRDARRFLIKMLRKKRSSSLERLSATSQKWTEGFTTQGSEILRQRTEGSLRPNDVAGTWKFLVERLIRNQSSVVDPSDKESFITHRIAAAETLLQRFNETLGVLSDLESALHAASSKSTTYIPESSDSDQTPSAFSLPIVGPRR